MRGIAAWGVLLAACSDEVTVPITPVDVTGRYELVTVGGQNLPVYLPIGQPPRVLLTADTIWLRPDSTYEQHVQREVIGPAPLYLIGRFSVSGIQLTLTETGRLDNPITAGPSQGKIPPTTPLTLMVGSGTAQFQYVRRCAGTAC
jgi:hypothetical protein